MKTASSYGMKLLKSRLGLNTETHWLDTVETNTATSATCASLSNPTIVPIGDSVNTRTGSTVRVTSYVCNLRIQANTAATAGCFVRVFFVKFKDCRGTTFGSSAFLDDNGRLTSPYNMGDTTSGIGYTVLFDKIYKIAVSGQQGDVAICNFVYKPLDYHLKWTSGDTTGTLANLQGDLVRGFIMTSEPGANTPNYWADHRIKFVDN